MTYILTEKEMELVCSIINTLIDESSGCKNGEYSAETNGMWMSDNGTWGFIAGSDMEEDEQDVVDALDWILTDLV